MNVLAFAASNSVHSINRQLVDYATRLLREEIAPGAQIETIDISNYEMSIYSIDRENADGIPDAAHLFFQKIGSADALIVSYAEHNGLYTAAFKNLFDWASRIEMRVFQEKPMLAMSASVGKNGGANVLKTALEAAPYFGADVRASLSVGPFKDKFDTNARALTDPALSATLFQALSILADSQN